MFTRGASEVLHALKARQWRRAGLSPLATDEIIVGCVADQKAKYLDQAFRLLLSWRLFAGKYSQCRFIICVAGGVPSGYAASLSPWQPELVGVEPVNEIHSASNKLLFLSLPLTRTYKRVILLDCDTVVLRQPEALFAPSPMLAKMADVASVPDAAFQEVFTRLGIAKPAANQLCTVSGEASIPYFNSGVLSFSAEAMTELVPAWIELNACLSNRPEWLGPHFKYLDQATLAIAVAKTKTEFVLLPQALNYPSHFKDPIVPALLGVKPVILHYHDQVTETGALAQSPYPLIKRDIDRFNAVLEQALRLRYASQEKLLGE